MKLIKIDLREYCGQIQSQSIFINQVNRVSRNVSMCISMFVCLCMCKWHINYILNIQLLLLLIIIWLFAAAAAVIAAATFLYASYTPLLLFYLLFFYITSLFFFLAYSHYLSLLPIIFNWFHIEYSVIVTNDFLNFIQ